MALPTVSIHSIPGCRNANVHFSLLSLPPILPMTKLAAYAPTSSPVYLPNCPPRPAILSAGHLCCGSPQKKMHGSQPGISFWHQSTHVLLWAESSLRKHLPDMSVEFKHWLQDWEIFLSTVYHIYTPRDRRMGSLAYIYYLWSKPRMLPLWLLLLFSFPLAFIASYLDPLPKSMALCTAQIGKDAWQTHSMQVFSYLRGSWGRLQFLLNPRLG